MKAGPNAPTPLNNSSKHIPDLLKEDVEGTLNDKVQPRSKFQVFAILTALFVRGRPDEPSHLPPC